MDPLPDHESSGPAAPLAPSRAGHIAGVVLTGLGGFLALGGGLACLGPHEGALGAVTIVFGLILLGVGGFMALLGGALLLGARRTALANPDHTPGPDA